MQDDEFCNLLCGRIASLIPEDNEKALVLLIDNRTMNMIGILVDIRSETNDPFAVGREGSARDAMLALFLSQTRSSLSLLFVGRRTAVGRRLGQGVESLTTWQRKAVCALPYRYGTVPAPGSYYVYCSCTPNLFCGHSAQEWIMAVKPSTVQ